MKKPARKLIALPVEMVVFCYQNGWSVGRIARSCGMSHTNIRKHLRNAGIVIARNDNKAELPATFVEEYLAGASKKALARKYNVTPSTIRRRLRQCGHD